MSPQSHCSQVAFGQPLGPCGCHHSEIGQVAQQAHQDLGPTSAMPAQGGYAGAGGPAQISMGLFSG